MISVAGHYTNSVKRTWLCKKGGAPESFRYAYNERLNMSHSSLSDISVSHVSPAETVRSDSSFFASSIVLIFSSSVPRVTNLWTVTLYC